MGTYNSAVITNAGQAMIAQSFAGSDLRFTTVKTSAYVYPAGTNFSELVTINSIKQSKGITGAAVYNSRVIKVSAMVDNAGITSAYDINTIGVYASVGTDAEQLFAVITAIDADTMPAFNNRPYSYIYELNLTVGSTENLTVTVNNAGFVNVNDLNVAVEGKLSTDGNASQVTVDFTSGDLADSDVTKDTGYTSVAKVDSGETATSLLTKISNVIKNVRWIYKLLGTSDISSVGNGTVTNAVTTLKSNVNSLNDAIATKLDLATPTGEITANSSLAAYTTPGTYACTSGATAATLSSCPISYAFLLKVEYGTNRNYIKQTIYGYAATHNQIPLYERKYVSGTWGDWFGYVISDGENMNSFYMPGKYVCRSGSTASSLTNCPTGVAFVLKVEPGMNSLYDIQTVYGYASPNLPIYMRVRTQGTWGNWVQIH